MAQVYGRHLSDEDLVLAADNELTRKGRAHFAACVECRNRAAELDRAMTTLTEAHSSSFGCSLPPVTGPRAMLRARISELLVRGPKLGTSARMASAVFAGAFGVAALLMLLTIAGLFGLPTFSSRTEYSPAFPFRQGVLPNSHLTPGAVRPVSLQQVCALAHEEVVKEVSPKERESVLEEYGIPAAQANEYELDYLIAPGLGGEDSIRNLWPAPYGTVTWNAHVKDTLEERLHQMVCSHQLDLSVAQQAIASNWIAAYEKYVGISGSHLRTGAAVSSAIGRLQSAVTRDRPPARRRSTS